MTLATFAIPHDPRSILTSCTGHAITVTLPTGNRVILLVSEKDHDKVVKQRAFKVTDLMTGQEHALVPADCGSGCRCAIAFEGVR